MAWWIGRLVGWGCVVVDGRARNEEEYKKKTDTKPKAKSAIKSAIKPPHTTLTPLIYQTPPKSSLLYSFAAASTLHLHTNPFHPVRSIACTMRCPSKRPAPTERIFQDC
ncbi:hypothetical protein HDK64DRAFT_272724 [Phyllosticta capitalensis]